MAPPIPPANPYRAILRREYPEPLIALLLFVLGIWLWDHYFGKNQGYAPGTEQVALVKIDRDLRLADAMVDDPVWLRFLAGADTPRSARARALEIFGKLGREKAISPVGMEAFAVVSAVQENKPVRQMIAEVMQNQEISDPGEISRDLASHGGTWWHAKLIDSWEGYSLPAAHWRESYGHDSLRLRTFAIVSRSVVWVLGLVGLVYIPFALRGLKTGAKTKRRDYGDGWTVPLGMVVFLVATLAWIGFTMTLEIGISSLPGLHPLMGILLDSAARMLPSLIALGLLFRHPVHAARVLGLGKSLSIKAVLGTFSLLMIADQILRQWIGSNDPGGGLSMGDAGWWGLAFALVSACLLAPVAEEILYRGLLFRSFKNRIGTVPAALVSAIIFAVLHFYDSYGLASVAIFGFSCALLYAATGSLSTVIALHMLYNTAIKLPEWIVYHAPLG